MPSPLFSQERAPTSVAYAELQSMFLDSLVGDAAWRCKYAISREGDRLPWALHEEEVRAKHPYPYPTPTPTPTPKPYPGAGQAPVRGAHAARDARGPLLREGALTLPLPLALALVLTLTLALALTLTLTLAGADRDALARAGAPRTTTPYP